MYLRELTINGFKSFAKKSDLEFSAPITAIVGPNGSGKSNVAESFRFVLGEQSVKSMRGKRGEDLIWGGSDAVTRGNRASVEVVFDNLSRSLDLDFDEVRLERVVHRDGQNEYKINGSVVRLKDIHELLAGAHIGATGHHIISQGEADRVISAGPRERRAMIEDALGLKVYQLKKHEAERKLAKTQDNIKQTESLRREAAPHLKYLKKQVERAERSLQLQADLQAAYAEYLKREDTYLALRTDTLQADRRAPVAELAEVTKTIDNLQTTLATAAEAEDVTAVTEATTVLEAAETALRQAERAVSTLEGQISYLERRLATPAPSATPTELIPRAELSSLIDDIVAQATAAEAHTSASAVVTVLQQVVTQLTEFIEGTDTISTDTTSADEAELATLTDQLPALQTAQQTAATAANEARQTLEAAQTAQQAKGAEHLQAERDLFTTLNRERELRQTLVTIDTELETLDRDRTDFKQELQEAVTLVGRGASQYFSHAVTDDAGVVLTEDDIAREPREVQRTRRRELEKLKIRLEELGIGGTEDLLKEYDEAKQRDQFLADELGDLTASVTNLESLIRDLDEQLHQQFVAGIDRISTEFNRFFTLMFGGGSAGLTRVTIKSRSDDGDDTESDELADEGVELSVALPNKRVKGLEMLSGGERALTSIALIFAMSQVNPPPFIILDETDAALDEANSRRYGDMIEALAERSQLILITHNRETMSRAGILYGITMGVDGVSKVLSVKFDEATEHAK